MGDKGYQGIQKIHKASLIPYKKNQKQKLSLQQKKYNRELASIRIVVEHVYRCLKIFKIISERYRNRRSRFSLRFKHSLRLKSRLATLGAFAPALLVFTIMSFLRSKKS